MLSLQTLHVCAKSFQSCLTVCDPTHCESMSLLCSLDSPSENASVGCHTLLWGSSPPRGLKKYVSHVSWMETVELFFFFFTISATWESLQILYSSVNRLLIYSRVSNQLAFCSLLWFSLCSIIYAYEIVSQHVKKMKFIQLSFHHWISNISLEGQLKGCIFRELFGNWGK